MSELPVASVGKPYLYEFFWRGREDDTSAYHAAIAWTVTDVMGNKHHQESGALTPEKLDELGFPLERILGAITTAMVKERDDALDAKRKAEEARATAESARDKERADKDAAIARAEAAEAALAELAETDAAKDA